jgi:3-deoxy-D-manno-octulosonic-acid transferase
VTGRSITGEATLALCGALATLATPLIARHIATRRRAGKEHETRWPERFGHAGRPRPPGPLVWLHAASVGEALSALPLIDRLRERNPAIGVLLTTGTISSAALAEARLPEGALHQFVPVDLPRAVDRFLDHWRPDLALWLESELWPSLLSRTARRGTRLILVNGRLSAASHRRWRLARPLVRALLGRFARLLAQSAADAARLQDLAGRPVACFGNLKRAAPPLPLPCDEAALMAIVQRRLGQPLWVAASTHPGEDAIVAWAHLHAAGRHPDLMTVIVPRHPARGPEICDAVALPGVAVRLRSRGDDLPAGPGIYVADTMGELGLWYRLAYLAFIGGSLVEHGGQNPLEAARLGCPPLFGPNMMNFSDVTLELMAARGAELVSADSLGPMVAALLSDVARRGALAEAAQRYATEQAGVLDAVMAEIAPYLPAV